MHAQFWDVVTHRIPDRCRIEASISMGYDVTQADDLAQGDIGMRLTKAEREMVCQFAYLQQRHTNRVEIIAVTGKHFKGIAKP